MSAGTRISVPVALLIVGVGLAGSTACNTGTMNTPARSPDHPTELAAAHRLLVATVEQCGGTMPPRAMTANAGAIQQALAMALPMRGRGPQSLPKDTCEVHPAPMENARAVFLVRVRSTFDSYYGEAFLDYVEAVRLQIEPAPIFRVTLVDAAGHARSPRELR